MAEGYICALTDIGSSTPNAFFDGYSMVESLDAAALYPTRADAKLATSQLHSNYIDRDIVYLTAKKTITLGSIGAVLPNDPTVGASTTDASSASA